MIHLYLHKLIERVSNTMCVYICIVVCRCVYVRVCADQSRLIVVWVTDPKPFPLTASSLFNTVQLEKKKVTWGSGEFLPHNDASVAQWGNAGQQSGLATGLLPHSHLWEHEGIMGDWSDRRWCEVLTAHQTRRFIQQRPGGASRFFLDGCDLGSYNLSDWHIQTLILTSSFHTRLK